MVQPHQLQTLEHSTQDISVMYHITLMSVAGGVMGLYQNHGIYGSCEFWRLQ